MKKIALTGNIGCGKSYVSKHLAKQGVFVFDCDRIAKDVRLKHQNEIADMFSVDASDAKALADLIFSNDVYRMQLEAFLYPKIIEELHHIFAFYANEKIIVVEVPLLFEKHWDVYFDEVWVVSANEDIALRRLCAYRNMDVQEARRRLAKQMPLSLKEEKADVIIYNNETDDVEKQILHLLKKEGFIC